MALQLRVAPSIEPISLSETKDFLRVDGTNEDVLISSLITTARIFIETTLSHIMITEQWSQFLDCWPENNIIKLALSPLQSIDEVRVYSSSTEHTVLDPSTYSQDLVSWPPRLNLSSTTSITSSAKLLNAIEVRFTAGYGSNTSDVPADLRHALMMLVAHWYEKREPVSVASNFVEVPTTVSSLMANYRKQRL